MGETRQFTKFTAKRKAAYLESLRNGASKASAAAACGVSRQLIWEYGKENKDFAFEEFDAKQVAIESVEGALHKSAVGGNTTAQIFYLKNRAPDRWTDVYDDVLRDRLKAEAKEEFAAVLTEAFTDEGVDAAVIERIATKLRSAARKKAS